MDDIVPISPPAVKHTLEHSNEVLVGVHSEAVCAGRRCPIHNLTDHHMRDRPQHFRADRGLMERICEHGVGHPDPDDEWAEINGNTIHGCDGCCMTPSRWAEVLAANVD